MTELWYAISQLWVGTFFFGIYFALFCICIHILLHRSPGLGNTVLIVTTIALFTLSTVQLIFNLILGAVDLGEIDIPYNRLQDAGVVIYAINNMIADGLVIYRCYSIWNNNVYVVSLPIVLLIVTTGKRIALWTSSPSSHYPLVFGLDFSLPTDPFFVLTLTTNILVTAMTAGRIWWIYRAARLYMQPDVQRRYMSALSILVESGMLYSATVLVYLILGAIPSTVVLQSPVFQILTQVMGIAPTLIIVRVGLGTSVCSFMATSKTTTSTWKHSICSAHSPENVSDIEKGLSECSASNLRPF
ncbi:Zn(2)-C6 fungal-type domain-containing protein [Mycena sanguinolenta]|uniref:Zn(2)-C6 fungal-type domain-containing protein n=1 Tax=Mycena sanguinolenta TaxID=230812 RepID=A0A8H6XCM2_9AGAR|nr:Zn(2)-C6 fungal-type domain-containing protein [Mycena sanguinolenta]